MKVSSYVVELGDILQEDFTYAPLWTKAELLGYLRLVLREFSARTLLADKRYLQLVNTTTGEVGLPDGFNQAYYARYHDAMVDLVKFGDLDFVDDSWIAGDQSTPTAATIIGAGTNAVVRGAPGPSAGGGSLEGVYGELGNGGEQVAERALVRVRTASCGG